MDPVATFSVSERTVTLLTDRADPRHFCAVGKLQYLRPRYTLNSSNWGMETKKIADSAPPQGCTLDEHLIDLVQGQELFFTQESFCFIFQHKKLVRSQKALIPFYSSCDSIGGLNQLNCNQKSNANLNCNFCQTKRQTI